AEGVLVTSAIRDISERKVAEESRARLASIVESSDDAIISKNLDRVITSWNAGAQRIFGYTAQEAVGQPITIIIPRELWGEEDRILERLMAGEHIEHYETIRLTKAGKRGDVSLSISPIHDSRGRIVGFSKISRDISERRLAQEALENLNRKLVEIQEEERARIARDLHDDINQQLAMLALEIDQLAQDRYYRTNETNSRLTAVRDRIGKISSKVQSISHQLHSPQLEVLGIAAAMRSFCTEFASRHKVRIDFTHEDIPSGVPREISLCLFRVLQEALHNAVKHSNARHCQVRLRCSENQLQLTISDRGTGFDTRTATSKGGLGLISMRERVRLVNGRFVIESKPMAGTTVDVRVPLGAGHVCLRAS